MSLRYLAAEGSGAKVVTPIWQEIVIGLLAFGFLLFIFAKYVFPRMEETFKARVDAIEGGIKRAEAAQAEANQLLEQYKEQLAAARTEAARIRDEARADAVSIQDDVLAKAREESDRIISSGRESLAAERATTIRRCGPRSGASRSTWPAGSSASPLRTRHVGGERSSGSSPNWVTSRPAQPEVDGMAVASFAPVSRESYLGARRAAQRVRHRGGRGEACRGRRRDPDGRRPAGPGAAAPARVGEIRRDRATTASTARRAAGRQGRRRRARAAARSGPGRWYTRQDLLNAVERLGVETLLAGADRGEELGEVEDELFRFGQVVDGDPRLAAALVDPRRRGRRSALARPARWQGATGDDPARRPGTVQFRRSQLHAVR